MEKHSIIKATKQEDPSSDFSLLRSEIIRYCQKLSGENWTDYNIHDPGVTIVEAAAYAMTDIAYRLNLPVEDWLYHDQSQLKVKEQHLLIDPEVAFTPRAVTVDDLRILLLDRFYDKLEQVYISGGKSDLNGLEGLYTIKVVPRDELNIDQKEALKKAIKQVFLKHRNCCEDLDKIIFLDPVFVTFDGTFILSNSVDPNTLLADILFATDRFLNPPVRFYSFDDLLADGLDIEDVFDRPSYSNGFIKKGNLQPRQKHFRQSRIRQLVGSLKGTQGLDNFILYLDGVWQREEGYELQENAYLKLAPFDENWDVFVVQNGKKSRLNPERVNFLLHELRRVEKVRNHHPYIKATPKQSRNILKTEQLKSYIPIEYELPSIYRVGDFSPTNNESNETQHYSDQLREYLSFFDQILESYLDRLIRLSNLYSIDTKGEVDQPYYESVKQRIYSHLLARMGLSYDYNISSKKSGNDTRLNQANLLAFIKVHGRFDGGGMRYHLGVDAEDFFPLHQKVCLVQGLENVKPRRLTPPPIQDWLTTKRIKEKEKKELKTAPTLLEESEDTFQFLCPEKDPLGFLLSFAKNEAQYDYVKDDGKTRVFFQYDLAQNRHEIGVFPDKRSAKKAIKDLINNLNSLESHSEGIHLIEHILLRPRTINELHFELFITNEKKSADFESIGRGKAESQQQAALDTALLGSYKNNYRIAGDSKNGYYCLIKDLNNKDRAKSSKTFDTKQKAEAFINESIKKLSDLKNKDRLNESVRIRSPKEYHLNIVDNLGAQLLTTTEVRRLDTLNELQSSLAEALQQGEGYAVKKTEEGSYEVTFSYKTIVFISPSTFVNEEEAKANIEQIKKTFRSIRPFADTSIYFELNSVFAQSANQYNYRVSCVYPSWVPRFREEGQVEALKKCIEDHLPAGVLLQMCPMDSLEIDRFEDLYFDFLDLLQEGDTSKIEQLNERASRLLSHLIEES